MSESDITALPYRRNVGVVLVNDAGRIFVGQRMDQNPAEPPAWQMPQGGIDPGEDIPTAALRELAEETGVTSDLVRIEAQMEEMIRYDLPADLIGKLWGGRFRGQEQQWVLMRFLGRDDQIRLDADEHQEFSAWRWSSQDEVIAHIVPFKREVYQKVITAFGAHLSTP